MANETEAMIGYGTIVELEDEESTGGWFRMGEVTDVSPPNESTDRVEATHMLSPGRYREYVQGLIEGGEATLDINWIPGNPTDEKVAVWRASGETKRLRFIYPNNFSHTFPSFPTGYAPSVSVGEKMAAQLTVAVAGLVARAQMT